MMIPVRIVLAIMAFSTTCNVYLSRINLNIALTDMVDRKSSGLDEAICRQARNETDFSKRDISISGNATDFGDKEESDKKFTWTNKQQGLMLGGYFYGYTAMMPFGGYLPAKIGLRNTVTICMIGSCLISFSYTFLVGLPTAGYYIGFILRFLTGVFHAPTFPTLQGMWTQWAPKQEKSRLVCAHFMGVPSGSVLISLIGGKLGGAFGWKSLFYFSGVANLVCGICWYILVRENPKSHPFISDEERNYILENRLSQKKPKKIPYKKLLTSLPFWAITVAHTTHLFNLYTFIQLFPKYLRDIQGYNIKEVGALASLPQTCTIILIVCGASISDFFHNKGYEWKVIRKGLNFCGSIIPSIMCFFYFFVGCNIVTVVVISMFTQTLLGFQIPGSKANLNDICPPYVAIGKSISNTFGSMPGFIAPMIAGGLLDSYGNNQLTWGYIWALSGTVLALGGTFYLIFADGEVQDWAKNDEEDESDDMIIKS